MAVAGDPGGLRSDHGTLESVDSASGGNERRRAVWLPADQDALVAWPAGHRERVATGAGGARCTRRSGSSRSWSTPIRWWGMYLARMIQQVPRTRRFRTRHLNTVEQLLHLINAVLTLAPEFGANMVATPIGAILDWTMGTPAGFAAIRNPRVNTALKKILNAWGAFLDTPDSRYVPDESPTGWKSATTR